MAINILSHNTYANPIYISIKCEEEFSDPPFHIPDELKETDYLITYDTSGHPILELPTNQNDYIAIEGLFVYMRNRLYIDTESTCYFSILNDVKRLNKQEFISEVNSRGKYFIIDIADCSGILDISFVYASRCKHTIKRGNDLYFRFVPCIHFVDDELKRSIKNDPRFIVEGVEAYRKFEREMPSMRHLCKTLNGYYTDN